MRFGVAGHAVPVLIIIPVVYVLVLQLRRMCQCQGKIVSDQATSCSDLKSLNRYRHPAGTRSFATSWEAQLGELGLNEEAVAKVDDESVLASRPAFATAFSDNHYTEARRLLRTIRSYYPSDLVHIFNIGISDIENKREEFLSDNPRIQFHTFNFSHYPIYVRDLVQYRWKPLVIATLLKEYKSVVWMDASIQWKNSNLNFSSIAQSIRDGSSPIQMPNSAGHSMYSTTHPNTYAFFGKAPLTSSATEKLRDPHVYMKKLQMYGANVMLLFGTQKALRDIVYWWILCALERDCMGPKGTKIGCNFKNEERWTKFADCHRYDQAVINVLAWHANCYNATKYNSMSSGMDSFLA